MRPPLREGNRVYAPGAGRGPGRRLVRDIRLERGPGMN